MPENIIISFTKKLEELKTKNLYRTLINCDISDSLIKINDKNLVSFACNDYFCLSQNEEVKLAAINAISKYGVGGRSSRYVTGNCGFYDELESLIAKLKNCDNSLVFGSGYLTAIGVIPALVEKGDLVIADRLAHSSLLDGVKLSGAKLLRFKHNDLRHCQEILAANRHLFKKCLIITETIFSMDGDIGKIPELLNLANSYDSLIVSDDAHGLGLVKFKLPENQKNYLQIGTLSKSVGAYGGYIAASEELIAYLKNFAKTAIYSTALPPAILASAIAALKIIERENLGEKVLENARYFCHLMNIPKLESAIVPIIIGDSKDVIEIANKVLEDGYLISAIRPPTVEIGKSRLRITFNSSHTKRQIEQLAFSIKAHFTKTIC